ncbi:aspartate-semialdehyde dehydrogenase [Fructobacillus fructosus]|uniref:hypothetical protein n=1 Tax=Fructobacillus fructosus TaxID=1631 RepID=UPI0002195779|nr:hypothetical protein [Fructobacillus fructosus]GAP01070.1 aspartate-semialdehyde dehydrogenase [Fructobacillus fructosus]
MHFFNKLKFKKTSLSKKSIFILALFLVILGCLAFQTLNNMNQLSNLNATADKGPVKDSRSNKEITIDINNQIMRGENLAKQTIQLSAKMGKQKIDNKTALQNHLDSSVMETLPLLFPNTNTETSTDGSVTITNVQVQPNYHDGIVALYCLVDYQQDESQGQKIFNIIYSLQSDSIISIIMEHTDKGGQS